MAESQRQIIVSGMGQSGSTALFNLVRWTCQAAGLNTFSHVHDVDGPKRPEVFDVIVRKDHLGREWKEADLMFVTKRDIRDCIASKRRRSGLAMGKHGAFVVGFHNIYLYGRGMEHGAIPVCYESMMADPDAVVQAIAGALNIGVASDDITKIVSHFWALLRGRCDVPPRQSGFVRQIITNSGIVGGYRSVLTTEEIELVDGCFGAWLKKEGYEVSVDISNMEHYWCLIKTLDDLFGERDYFGVFWASDKNMRPDLRGDTI